MNTVERYKKGLIALNLSSKQIEMLKAHYSAPDRRITMAKLSYAVGYKKYSASNLHYGMLAKKLCIAMNTEPDDFYKDGSPFWLSLLAEAWRNKDGEYEFQMWPELAEALTELGLV